MQKVQINVVSLALRTQMKHKQYKNLYQKYSRVSKQKTRLEKQGMGKLQILKAI